MDKRDFQLVDFSEPMWRNKDMALWQWDLFFVKKKQSGFSKQHICIALYTAKHISDKKQS
jgi:hypothetical protein